MTQSGISVDLSQFTPRLARLNLKRQDLLDIEGAGAYVLVNGIRMRAPVGETAALKNSVHPHIIESSDTRVVDDVGPEVEYAPYVEYGTGEFAEAGNGRKGGWRYKDAHGNWHFTYGMKPQPYMRPAAAEDKDQIISAIDSAIQEFING